MLLILIIFRLYLIYLFYIYDIVIMDTHSNITHWLSNSVSKIMKDVWASKEYSAILIVILTLWILTKVDNKEEIIHIPSKNPTLSVIETSLSTVLEEKNLSKLDKYTITADTIDMIVENTVVDISSLLLQGQQDTLLAQRE